MRHRVIGSSLAFLALLMLMFHPALQAAEHRGRSIDGQRWRGTAYSFASHRSYAVEIVFSGSEASVTFPRGQRLTLLLEDERIEDLRHIAATDDASGNKFELAVDLKR